ncbi:undecaprenyl-diphosphate phosphatase, partial [Kitasatospora nipponensis]|uniref:undecaprenyl-diphosphate phosphatase n=1 Tax=Kitasatospora nipponensis TaxID=258049 RepID=UPI0031D4DAD5
GIFGALFQDTIETTLRDLRVIGTTLIVFGVILAVADRTRAVRHAKPISELTLPHAIGYGLAQSLALIPGVSRSGGTISAGLLLGYSREAAVRYSFLLAIPAVLASGVLELFKIGEGPAPAWGPTIMATLIAFVVGYAAIAWFLKYISSHSFMPFVVYRVLLGIVIIGLVTAGVLARD